MGVGTLGEREAVLHTQSYSAVQIVEETMRQGHLTESKLTMNPLDTHKGMDSEGASSIGGAASIGLAFAPKLLRP